MLRELARTVALRSGYTVRRRIDEVKIRSLLARLAPVETGIELIRLGGEGDGGYLVPDDLDGLSACFSPGVDVTAGFEEAMVARGVRCHLIDASVSAAPVSHPLIEFEPKFLGASNEGQTITLDAWVAAKAPGNSDDLILQMGIEGHEWAVLLNASEAVLSRFRVIVIELHGLSHSFDYLLHMLMDSALGRLGQLFHVVHVHPNNATEMLRHGDLVIPDLLEVTLLRRDRAQALGPARRFPHPLDRPNLPDRHDLPLPESLQGRPT